jgi:hypothetical protein
MRFGYPITTPYICEVETGEVLECQYFERRIMEIHPADSGGSAIMLSRLGALLR